MNVPPPLASDTPPLLPPQPKPGPGRRFFAILLSLCLGLFLADAAISFLDDLLILAFGSHAISILRGLIAFATLLMSAAIYGLIGLTPMVPKRYFLPLPLFSLATLLGALPFTIYFYSHLQQIALAASVIQLALGMYILYRAQGRTFRWPPISADHLGTRIFSWAHLSVFVLLNLFVLLPLVIVFLFSSAAHGVNHISEGFMALHPTGFTVQMRKYVRNDGKVIELFPMAHVADANFYRNVSQSFPTNSIILMEGVTDERNLLTNQISYARMAKTLGLAEQHQTFAPTNSNQGVRADVDVGQFSKETLDFLNLVMLLHSKGVTTENLLKVMQWPAPPDFEKQLFEDILTRRNEHLMQEIQSYLPQSDTLVVPWGVAHMPGIAREIQKSGFRLAETHDYVVIHFGKSQNK